MTVATRQFLEKGLWQMLMVEVATPSKACFPLIYIFFEVMLISRIDEIRSCLEDYISLFTFDVYMSVCLSVCLSVWLTVCLSVCLYVCIYVNQLQWSLQTSSRYINQSVGSQCKPNGSFLDKPQEYKKHETQLQHWDKMDWN